MPPSKQKAASKKKAAPKKSTAPKKKTTTVTTRSPQCQHVIASSGKRCRRAAKPEAPCNNKVCWQHCRASATVNTKKPETPIAKKPIRVAKRTGRGKIAATTPAIDHATVAKMSRKEIDALADKLGVSEYVKKNKLEVRRVVEFRMGFVPTDGLQRAPFARRTGRVSDVLDNDAIPFIEKRGYKVVDDIVPARMTSWGERIKRTGYGNRNSGLLLVTGGRVPRGQEGLAKIISGHAKAYGEDPEREIKTAMRMGAAGIGPRVYDAIKYSAVDNKGNTEDVYVLIMERMDGSLDDLVPFQPPEMNGILTQVVTLFSDALIAHRVDQNDAKPGNYLFKLGSGGRYRIVLGDYGNEMTLKKYDAHTLKTSLKENMDYFMNSYREMELKEDRRPHWTNLDMVREKMQPILDRAYARIDSHFAKLANK